MSHGKLEYLLEDFPTLYTDFTRFDCREGWFDIIADLSLTLADGLIDELPDPDSFRVIQVKEKFGGLRFYVSNATEKITEAIRKAEDLSYETCEWCGKPGSGTTDGRWNLTLCQDHKLELGRT